MTSAERNRRKEKILAAVLLILTAVLQYIGAVLYVGAIAQIHAGSDLGLVIFCLFSWWCCWMFGHVIRQTWGD